MLSKTDVYKPSNVSQIAFLAEVEDEIFSDSVSSMGSLISLDYFKTITKKYHSNMTDDISVHDVENSPHYLPSFDVVTKTNSNDIIINLENDITELQLIIPDIIPYKDMKKGINNKNILLHLKLSKEDKNLLKKSWIAAFTDKYSSNSDSFYHFEKGNTRTPNNNNLKKIISTTSLHLFSEQIYEKLIAHEELLNEIHITFIEEIKSIIELIGKIIGNLDNPHLLDPDLEILGKRHSRILGTSIRLFELVGIIFVETLKERLDPLFSRKLEYLWNCLYMHVINKVIHLGTDPIISERASQYSNDSHHTNKSQHSNGSQSIIFKLGKLIEKLPIGAHDQDNDNDKEIELNYKHSNKLTKSNSTGLLSNIPRRYNDTSNLLSPHRSHENFNSSIFDTNSKIHNQDNILLKNKSRILLSNRKKSNSSFDIPRITPPLSCIIS